jgi:chloramphenicol 3-O-phosphotransferase
LQRSPDGQSVRVLLSAFCVDGSQLSDGSCVDCRDVLVDCGKQHSAVRKAMVKMLDCLKNGWVRRRGRKTEREWPGAICVMRREMGESGLCEKRRPA